MGERRLARDEIFGVFTGSKLQTHSDAAQGADGHERDAHVQV